MITSNELTLFVGDLPANVHEHDLNQLFQGYSVQRIVIPRDHDTKVPRGFAFVSFQNTDDATKARRAINGNLFQNKRILISLCSSKLIKDANIFVKGLHPDTNTRELESFFSVYGVIVSSKISYNSDNVSKGYGFIQFQSKDEAELALSQSSGSTLHGSLITVQRFVPIQNRVDQYDNKNLYVRGFDDSMTNDKFQAIFSRFGEITSHVLLNAKSKSGETLHFGFVAYAEEDSAERAKAEMHQKMVEGMQWYVVNHVKKGLRMLLLRRQHMQKLEGYKGRNLYISKLPSFMTEEDFRQYCGFYGEVESVKLLCVDDIRYDENGQRVVTVKSKGSGFVCYVTVQMAASALIQLRNSYLLGVKPYVVRWLPRQELAKKIRGKNQAKRQEVLLKQAYDRICRQCNIDITPPHQQENRYFNQNKPRIQMPGTKSSFPQPRYPFQQVDNIYDKHNPKRKSNLDQIYQILLTRNSKIVSDTTIRIINECSMQELQSIIQNPEHLKDYEKRASSCAPKKQFVPQPFFHI